MRSEFNKPNPFPLGHSVGLTCKMGLLTPIMCEEVIPGDYWRDTTNILVRLSPMLAPMMHQVDVYSHFFFVPNRLVMPDWVKFITGGKDGDDATVPPYVTAPAGGWLKSSLMDYLGGATGVAGITANAMFPRAYDLIYNEYYRSQDLQPEVTISLGNGSDTTTSLELKYRNWERDYFTSALDEPQRGDPVTIPLGDTANVITSATPHTTTGGVPLNFRYEDGTAIPGQRSAGFKSGGSMYMSTVTGDNYGVSVYPTNLVADLTSATSVEVRALTLAIQIQRVAEINKRGGVRYPEFLLNHFDVVSSDATLQRPQYLGGGKSPVVVSEVLQTSSTDTTSPQGNMAGHGFSGHVSHTFSNFFEEYGIVIGILSIMPKPSYMQGQRRMFNRSTRFDYYLPAYAHLGEQAIFNREIYAQGTSTDAEVWGYAPRFEELRSIPNRVCGEFKDTMDYWHMARKFDDLPPLSGDFVSSEDITNRIFAYTGDADNCFVQVYHDLKAVRRLPRSGEPGFLDHV